MPRSLELEFMSDDRLAGFRLQRLEVFNWGTFDRSVYSLKLHGKNYLLTGEIGSGKSTLVDAVTTLLVPSHRVAYNKAAGAEGRERSLRTYVQGHYKSERQEENLIRPKSVALRDLNSYSVILGVFYNEGYSKTVCLAQVFWIKDPNAQPARLYVVSEQDLSISADFSSFGSDISNLRKKLRSRGFDLFDNFPAYGAKFRRFFGIENDQALELFHQTVSLKSVGNLTEFVRSHMLEPFDVKSRIAALIEHYDDLNRAHEAIVNARQQIAMLEPLVSDCDRHQKLEQTVDRLRNCRDALSFWFASLKLKMLEQRLNELAQEKAKQQVAIEGLEQKRQQQLVDERSLRLAISENGGDRIENLAQEIHKSQEELGYRKKKSERYSELLQGLDKAPAASAEEFSQQRSELQTWLSSTEEADVRSQNALNEAGVLFKQGNDEYSELQAEIRSLKARVSNIDEKQIAMRRMLCSGLQLAEADLPFAGELLQVRKEEQDWEGAIERLLRGFGLSLLVHEEHYAKVAQWVDKTELKGRLVYYRMPERTASKSFKATAASLLNKLQIKPDSPFYSWIEQELQRRFDLICCDSQEQFRREVKAITKTGQIKGSGGRHEKDDRFRIDDRRRYVLGWSNAEKIAALERDAKLRAAQLAKLAAEISELQQVRKNISQHLQLLSKLGEYNSYRELDWQTIARHIANLENEKRKLETTSDKLKSLSVSLAALEEELKETHALLDKRKDQRSKTEERISYIQGQKQQVQGINAEASEEIKQHFPALAELRQSEFANWDELTLQNCDKQERELRNWLQDNIDGATKKIKRLGERIVEAMSGYRNRWKLETQEVDANIGAAHEYKAMLERLKVDDLPRFEERFKELLNENTIREVANFQSQLARERVTIKERIAKINKSLTEIDYNLGRYIRLEGEDNNDYEIKAFQAELRSCTEGTLTGSEDAQYSEQKFLQVKKIIERFRGKEASSGDDQRWTEKVTDVRNWFVFAASERWRENDAEFEHYADSSGKSGGQKEKLAYTVLAASLAYQFGLEWNEVRSRSFRFVVIDEAFGRGSDESAEYALQLFAKLNLQLLIVTPLQKTYIIENFVSGVGYVHNLDGSKSVLRDMPIEQYRAEKQRHQSELDQPSRT